MKKNLSYKVELWYFELQYHMLMWVEISKHCFHMYCILTSIHVPVSILGYLRGFVFGPIKFDIIRFDCNLLKLFSYQPPKNIYKYFVSIATNMAEKEI